ncbi:hypothetical protein Q0Z83_036730 [Actinoplanes sichuanensis]|nr:hypothetical protein Q0Z83_036730 [Actinoplanes sichuanensis]
MKNTFRSCATATTVFGRDRTARDSRYASSTATPNLTTRPPAASRDRTNRKPLHNDIQEPLNTRSTSTNMPWITKDYLHIKQISAFSDRRQPAVCRRVAGG